MVNQLFDQPIRRTWLFVPFNRIVTEFLPLIRQSKAVKTVDLRPGAYSQSLSLALTADVFQSAASLGVGRHSIASVIAISLMDRATKMPPPRYHKLSRLRAIPPSGAWLPLIFAASRPAPAPRQLEAVRSW